MCELASGWAQTVTAINPEHLRELTGLDPAVDLIRLIRQALPVKEVPECEQWRLGLLDALLALRSERQKNNEEVKSIVAQLSSLCST